MPRWGMVIDITKCVGCDACTIACKLENQTPGDIWYAPVIHQEEGQYPNARMVFVPTLCMHCDDAPCVKACPTSDNVMVEVDVTIVFSIRDALGRCVDQAFFVTP